MRPTASLWKRSVRLGLFLAVAVFLNLSVQAQDPGWILYSRPFLAQLMPQWGLFAMRPDGSSQVELARGAYFAPRATRDGSFLVFSAPHVSVPVSMALYSVPVEGGMPILLTPPIGLASDPSFSPDQTRVVYSVNIPPQGGTGGPTPTTTPRFSKPGIKPYSLFPSQSPDIGSTPSSQFIAIAHMDGSDAIGPMHKALPNQGFMQMWQEADWHPTDENRIAVSIKDVSVFPGAALYVITPDASQIQLLFPPMTSDVFTGTWEEDHYPTWSPDGQYLAYVRQLFNANTMVSTYSIYIMRADASDAPGRQIIPEFQSRALGNGIVHIDWSPDGEWLTYSVVVETDPFGVPLATDLFKVRRDGSELTRLTEDGMSAGPTWFSGPQLPSGGLNIPTQMPTQATPSPVPTPPPPAPTPTVTPTPTRLTQPTPPPPLPTPTPTRSVGFTPTPIAPPPGGLPQPWLIYEFDQADLTSCGWKEIPGGVQAGTPSGQVTTFVFVGQLIPSSQDKVGIKMTVASDQVAFVHALQPLDSAGAALLFRLTIRADAPGAAVALAALKGSLVTGEALDGSIATHIPATAAAFVEGERRLVLVYEPDSAHPVTPIIQVASKGGADGTVNVFVDRLEVYRINREGWYPGRLFLGAP